MTSGKATEGRYSSNVTAHITLDELQWIVFVQENDEGEDQENVPPEDKSEGCMLIKVHLHNFLFGEDISLGMPDPLPIRCMERV